MCVKFYFSGVKKKYSSHVWYNDEEIIQVDNETIIRIIFGRREISWDDYDKFFGITGPSTILSVLDIELNSKEYNYNYNPDIMFRI